MKKKPQTFYDCMKIKGNFEQSLIFKPVQGCVYDRSPKAQQIPHPCSGELLPFPGKPVWSVADSNSSRGCVACTQPVLLRGFCSAASIPVWAAELSSWRQQVLDGSSSLSKMGA